jgi:3-hydroxyisobutyrate dehydrogenase-like beta-hydroxyacid dehydrogenase
LTKAEPVAVIGIGLMGTAVTDRLLAEGYDVRVWSRYASEASPVIGRGARWSDHPLVECDRVILCLYSSAVVADVLDAMSSDLRASQIIIDTTTGSPDDAVIMAARLASKGVYYLDAPFSGSSVQASRGEALLMVGGDRSVYETCQDLWSCLAGEYHYTGATGSAAKMKLVTNLVLGINRAALAEGLSYAKAIGIDAQAALEILRRSPAASVVMQTKGDKMVAEDFSVQAKLAQHLKDVLLILESSRAQDLRLPLTETHRLILETVVQLGFGDFDNSSVIRYYQNQQPER